MNKDQTVTMQITPKGVLMTAVMLYERGCLRRKTVDRVKWFYDSGVGWENAEFRKLWMTSGPMPSPGKTAIL